MFLIILGLIINITLAFTCMLWYNIDFEQKHKEKRFLSNVPQFVKILMVISVFVPYMVILTLISIMLYRIIVFITTEL